MTLKKHILSRVTRDNSSWVEQNDYDLENYEEIRANTFIVLRIKQYMKEKGLKQNELAEILNVTPQYVNKLLHGQVRNIGVGTLLKYGNKLGLRQRLPRQISDILLKCVFRHISQFRS